jgi:glycosyltransferase involved in cell wall biosynthesis
MRIVYLHQYFNTPDMAGGTRSYEMARRLVAAGHEVRMVTSWREGGRGGAWFTTDEAGIEVHWLPVPYNNRMGFADRMRAFVRFAWHASRKAASLPADVVFATSTPLSIALPGYFASRRRRAPMVFEVRDLWPDVPIEMGIVRNPLLIWVARRLESLAYRSASRVVALAPGMKEAVVRRGVPAEHVAVIPNGCDFDIFPTTATAADTPPPLQAAGNGRTTNVVYMGTIGLTNGVEFIPRLAHALRLRADAPDVRFFIIGDGRQREAVEDLSRELGVLGESVTLLDALTKRDLARWVSGADATIMSYDGPAIVFRDSVANKFFDSLAAGKAVIANYEGFATLLAREAGAGFIIDRDPSVAADQLAAIIADPDALVRAGKAASRLARDRFDRDDQAAQLQQVLEEAVAEASRH